MNRSWAILITVLLVLTMAVSIFLFTRVYKTPENAFGSSKNTKETTVVFNTGSPFITNIKETRSILKCDIYIETSDKMAEPSKEEMAQIRDRIITILRDLTAEDIEKQDIQERLKKVIKEELQSELDMPNITDIYFNEFIVQH